jgi:hypothetical protein
VHCVAPLDRVFGSHQGQGCSIYRGQWVVPPKPHSYPEPAGVLWHVSGAQPIAVLSLLV